MVGHSRSLRSAWEALVLIAAAFLVFWPVLDIGLLSDDHVAVWRTGVHGTAWRTAIFRPVADLSIQAGHFVHGPSAFGFRCVNVAAHGISAWLVLLLVRQWCRYMPPGQVIWTSWVAAALFVVYPFHLEPVIWIVGREAAFGTVFTLLALVILGSGFSPAARVVGMSVAYSLGALCYETAFLLPLMVLPLAWRYRAFQWPAPGHLFIALAVATVLHFLLRIPFRGDLVNSYGTTFLSHDLSIYLLNIPKVIGRLFLPPGADPMVMVGAFIALLSGVLVGMVFLRRRMALEVGSPHLFPALLWCIMVACLMPVVGGVSTRTSESDRFLYMPSAFLVILVALGFSLLRRPRIKMIAAILLSVVSVALLLLGQRNWRVASQLTTEVVRGLPAPPDQGRLFVHDLPDAYAGAYVFRHGWPEAMLLAGRDTARIVIVPTEGTQPIAVTSQDEEIHLVVELEELRFERSATMNADPEQAH